MHPDGTRVYVSLYETHDVGVIDTQNNVMPPSYITRNDMSMCNICPHAIAVAMTPDGQFAYVGNKNSDPVAVIDTDISSPSYNTRVAPYIPVGGTPTGLAVTPQPVPRGAIWSTWPRGRLRTWT